MTSGRAIEDQLTYYSELVDRALPRYLPDREPRRHLYDLVRSYPARPAKRLRPSLVFLTAGAFGAEPEAALASAVAIEILHNAILIHDDVVDGSEKRRGLETLHRQHGEALALNAGDAMFALAMLPLFDNLRQLRAPVAFAVATEFQHMVLETAEGQAIELGWVRDNDCTLVPDDYLRMCLKKTCWYTTIHPCRIGAIIGSDGTVQPDRFNRFGYFMGASFQIQDDLLNLVGSYDRYGKEIAGDLLEGKRTLMLIHLLSSAKGRDKAWLCALLARPREAREDVDVRRVFALMEKHGSLEYGATSARFLAGAALNEFENVYGDLPDSEEKSFVRDIVLYMIERDL